MRKLKFARANKQRPCRKLNCLIKLQFDCLPCSLLLNYTLQPSFRAFFIPPLVGSINHVAKACISFHPTMTQHTVVMPKSKKTKLKPRKEVCVRCISCKKRFQALLYANSCVRSAGLSRHLYSSSRRLCFDFYQRNGIFLDVGGKGNFRTSMLPQRTRQDEIPPLSLSLP